MSATQIQPADEDAGVGPTRQQRSRQGNSSRSGGGSRRGSSVSKHGLTRKQEKKQEKKQERQKEKDEKKEKRRRGSRVAGQRSHMKASGSESGKNATSSSSKGKEPTGITTPPALNVPCTKVGSSADGSASARISDRPISVRKFVLGGKVTHPNMLMQPSLADVEFTTADGATLHAHSYVLLVRCEELANMVHPAARREKWRTNRPRRHTVESVNLRGSPLLTRDVLSLILDYLYRGECDLSIENAAVLASLALRLSVAAEQLQLRRLALLAYAYVRSVTTLENCAKLLRLANELKSLANKAFLLNYIHKHQQEVVKEKSTADVLGLSLFQEVVALAFNPYEEPEPLETPPESTFIQDFQRLYDAVQQGDVAPIYCWSDAFVRLGDQTIPFNKAVVAGASKLIGNLLHPSPKEEDLTATLGLVEHPLSADCFRAFLRFVYYRDDKISIDVACQLVNFAQSFVLYDLQSVCENVIFGRIRPASFISVLGITYEPMNAKRTQMLDMRERCLKWIGVPDNLKRVDLAPLASLPHQAALDIVAALQNLTVRTLSDSGSCTSMSITDSPARQRSGTSRAKMPKITGESLSLRKRAQK